MFVKCVSSVQWPLTEGSASIFFHSGRSAEEVVGAGGAVLACQPQPCANSAVRELLPSSGLLRLPLVGRESAPVFFRTLRCLLSPSFAAEVNLQWCTGLSQTPHCWIFVPLGVLYLAYPHAHCCWNSLAFLFACFPFFFFFLLFSGTVTTLKLGQCLWLWVSFMLKSLSFFSLSWQTFWVVQIAQLFQRVCENWLS